nr:MAG: replication associated protein [Cressdnaviricota sp.]
MSGWLFTLHAMSCEEGDAWCLDGPPYELPHGCRFLIYQVEVAPTSNQVHLQGYVYTNTWERLSFVRRLFDGRAHWEKARGNAAQNIAYCSKEESAVAGPFTFGDPPHQGSSAKLEEAITALKDGATLASVAFDYSQQWALHYRGFESLRRMLLPPVPAWRELYVQWMWGTTGVGKTRAAYAIDPSLYCVRGDGTWWDGYEDQKTILFDEFYGQIKMQDMLRWLDGYPVALPVKGGFTEARWLHVILTSNVDPKGADKSNGQGGYEWNVYAKVPDEIRAAFFRRVNDIVNVE